MKAEIEEINQYLGGAESVIIEAAHIYADKQPGGEQKVGAQIAAQISAGLNAMTRRVLLIDDYNIGQKTLDIDAYVAAVSGWGFIPDDLFMESDLVTEAPFLVDRIRNRKSTKLKNWEGSGVRFWTPHGIVGLIKPDGRPTCPALDALLYEKKATLGSACVTVLPIEYSTQQQATQSVMGKAGISIPIANLYFDQRGGRTLVLNK